MRFLIVAFHPRSMTPYAKQYEDAIIKACHDYDILFWDRFSNAPLEKKSNEFIFHRICTLGGNRLKKLYPFYLFRKTLRKIITNGKYNKIVILNTMPGFLLHDILLKYYQGRYVLDIRDYTYEKYNFYLRTVHQLIDNSFFTAISSRGFKRFLGDKDKLVINHNISNFDNIEEIPSLTKDKKVINIGFVGAIRYFDENVTLIKSLQNSSYLLAYYGREAADCHLKDFCKNMNITNAKFFGEFKNEEKPFLYKNIDMINSFYGNMKMEVQSLLPNRLYDALIFKKPIIATEGTYLAEVVRKYAIGFSLPGSQDYNQIEYRRKIEEYINNFDPDTFTNNAEKLLEVVIKEQKMFHKRIDEFVKK